MMIVLRKFSTSFTVKNIVATRQISALLSTVVTHVHDADKLKLKRLIIKPKYRRPIVQKQRERNAQLDEKAKTLSMSWRYLGATILHRYPVVTPDPTEWETQMWEMQDKMDDMKRKWLLDQIGGTDSQIFPDNNPVGLHYQYYTILDLFYKDNC